MIWCLIFCPHMRNVVYFALYLNFFLLHLHSHKEKSWLQHHKKQTPSLPLLVIVSTVTCWHHSKRNLVLVPSITHSKMNVWILCTQHWEVNQMALKAPKKKKMDSIEGGKGSLSLSQRLALPYWTKCPQKPVSFHLMLVATYLSILMNVNTVPGCFRNTKIIQV